MSRGIVSQKPFLRKKRRQSIRRTLSRSGVSVPEFKISQKLKNILSRGLCFTLLIIGGILVLIKSLFFKSEQIISQIKFSESTLATYQDIELFNMVSDEVKGKNYYVLLSNKDELVKKIQKKFPFVGKIELQLETTQEEVVEEQESIIIGIKFPDIIQGTGSQIGTGGKVGVQFIQSDFPLKSSKFMDDGGILGVQLMYYEPTVLVQLNDKKFAVWNETVYAEIKEGMLLGIRIPTEDDPEPEQLFLIETPQYLTGTKSLDGFFFEISLPELLQIATLAKQEFGSNMLRFVYLVGSTRFAIFTSDQKTLYFNFPEGGNIEDQRNSQIFKYNTLREKYDKRGNIDKIDLGSLENNKTIIQNY